MTDPTGHRCPQCGAPRGADHTPSCGCTRQASDALRDARTAEQAAAEDFDPLRIRPYVELEHDEAAHAAAPVAAAEATMPLRAVSGEAPSPGDLRLFEGAGPETAYARAEEAARRPRGRGRLVLLGACGAVVAVVAAAGLASGLFSYDKPSRDGALPEDVRASVPDASTSAASAPSPENAVPVRPSASSSATPAPTGSTSPSLSASPSASASSSASTSPNPSGSAGRASPTATATPSLTPGLQPTSAPVLRPGSQGPEVTELELRLTQLGLYTRKPRGFYDKWVESAVGRYQWARGIQGDEQGVYGAETRARLESETRKP
ncbi:peptidoglycan-binding domain-containing protein [Streptomyces sp. NPDC101225]|uniref:peptidoglycan-binding domain-containing protein n=1 Tax=Streptomyces sp. NPDC101225 TaxID=3366135 RepID=UPI003807D61B